MIITGAASGIGRATVLAFANAGAGGRCRRVERLTELAAQIEGPRGSVKQQPSLGRSLYEPRTHE